MLVAGGGIFDIGSFIPIRKIDLSRQGHIVRERCLYLELFSPELFIFRNRNIDLQTFCVMRGGIEDLQLVIECLIGSDDSIVGSVPGLICIIRIRCLLDCRNDLHFLFIGNRDIDPFVQ